MSLRKAGFTVTTSESVNDAIEKLEVHQPDLIVSETAFADGDGFELCRRVRATPDWGDIPFIFLTAELAIENKIRGLELGVDDYLTKPIYIKEIITRINILLQKRQRARFEERRGDGRTRFAGRVADMPVVDVIQTIEISRKSGVIQFIGERDKQATIYFRDGRVIDAEAGALQGEDAVYRLLTWNDGEFEVVFRTVRRREVIQMSSQGLLMEGMRRLDEWSRILEQVPPLSHRFEIDVGELAVRLGEIPDDNNRLLRLIDGKRTLFEVIDASDVGDLECLQTFARLYFEDILIDLDHAATERKRDTGRQAAFQPSDAPTPIEDAASGPISSDHVRVPPVVEAAPEAQPSEPVSAIESAETAPTDLADVLSEEDVDPEMSPLLGGFRPSSLRKIDEAVEAAQAIEPSLFAGIHDLDDAPVAIKPSEDTSIPTAIEDERPPAPPPVARIPIPKPPPELMALGRDDSGLRMIGSLGRDRAEASGELRPSLVMAAAAAPVEPARELVTIKPRRKTAEVPIPPPPVADAVTAEAATAVEAPTEDQVVTAQLPVLDRIEDVPEQRPDVELPPPSEPRRITGATIALVALAVVLAIVAIVVKTRKHAAPQVATIVDAGRPSVTPIVVPDAARIEVPIDAAPRTVPADAAIAAIVVDAAELVAPVDAPIDTTKEAKRLYEQAFVAIEESDYAKALALADQSLKLRRTARTYLVKATALQRLGRVDDAIDAIDLAIDIFKRNGTDSGAAWAQKGRVLWAAGRKDEAKVAFTHYLELDPNSPDAKAIHKMIDE